MVRSLVLISVRRDMLCMMCCWWYVYLIVFIFFFFFVCVCVCCVFFFFFFQAEDGIRDLVRSRGLGDVYKRQGQPVLVVRYLRRCRGVWAVPRTPGAPRGWSRHQPDLRHRARPLRPHCACLLYTSDAADERSSVDLGGRRIIKKKTKEKTMDIVS